MEQILQDFAEESDTPPYLRIRQGLAADIAAGRLAVGARLPSVRALATRLGVATNTVARAYKELEATGVVATHGRNGTIVTSKGSTTPARVSRAAETLAREAAAAGLSEDAVMAVVTAAMAAHR